ncbi:hypothetical protein CEXT_804301 [Caerostris extrusa]|uniref:Uncharacterized protein n=1 Tax=Caerostris extrusa TaxID=172846 RepID=A0AAV4X9B6_CAEEX|nr:hypothetical protein CEXT_804301 [Caerostris extrusa]
MRLVTAEYSEIVDTNPLSNCPFQADFVARYLFFMTVTAKNPVLPKDDFKNKIIICRASSVRKDIYLFTFTSEILSIPCCKSSLSHSCGRITRLFSSAEINPGGRILNPCKLIDIFTLKVFLKLVGRDKYPWTLI